MTADVNVVLNIMLIRDFYLVDSLLVCSTETDVQNAQPQTREWPKHFISSILDADRAEFHTFLTLRRLYSGASDHFLSAVVNASILTDKAPELLLRF